MRLHGLTANVALRGDLGDYSYLYRLNAELRDFELRTIAIGLLTDARDRLQRTRDDGFGKRGSSLRE